MSENKNRNESEVSCRQAFLEFDAKAEVDRCDAIAREGFAMLDAEEAKLEH